MPLVSRTRNGVTQTILVGDDQYWSYLGMGWAPADPDAVPGVALPSSDSAVLADDSTAYSSTWSSQHIVNYVQQAIAEGGLAAGSLAFDDDGRPYVARVASGDQIQTDTDGRYYIAA